MDDLEAELLALAGDDSGDQEELPQSPPARSPTPLSPADSPVPTTEKPTSPSPVRRGTAQKKMNKAKAGAKKRTQDDSEEEGEA